MFLHQAELDNSLLFYMGATVLYGGTIFYRAKKNRVEKAPPFRWGLLLLLTLEVLCFTTLGSSLGLTLFSLACLGFCFYTPAQAMLPVNRKAVFITGKGEASVEFSGWVSRPNSQEEFELVFSKITFRRDFGLSLANIFSWIKLDLYLLCLIRK